MFNEKIVNIQSGEETIRNYSPKELDEVSAELEKAEKEKAELAIRQAARLAIFEKLGLNEEEAKLLLG